VGAEQGIILAIVLLSLIAHTRHDYRPRNVVLSQDATGRWHPEPVFTATEFEPGLLFYRFTHAMYYANSEQLSQEVSLLVKQADPALSWLCIEASSVDDVLNGVGVDQWWPLQEPVRPVDSG
jgi:MFS superfamily sulfate permease-like transporter